MDYFQVRRINFTFRLTYIQLYETPIAMLEYDIIFGNRVLLAYTLPVSMDTHINRSRLTNIIMIPRNYNAASTILFSSTYVLGLFVLCFSLYTPNESHRETRNGLLTQLSSWLLVRILNSVTYRMHSSNKF